MEKPAPILRVSFHHLFFVFPFFVMKLLEIALNFTGKTMEALLSLSIQNCIKTHHPEQSSSSNWSTIV